MKPRDCLSADRRRRVFDGTPYERVDVDYSRCLCCGLYDRNGTTLCKLRRLGSDEHFREVSHCRNGVWKAIRPLKQTDPSN